MTPIGTNSAGIPNAARSGSIPSAGPAGQALVHRGQHDRLHRGPDVHPPEGHRPVDLRPVVAHLVGLPVAAVVDRLADARHELRRALADPAPEGIDVLVLPAGGPDLAAPPGLGDHHQALALAEAGRGRPLGEPRDPLDHRALHPAVLEPADGAALHDDVGELHGCLLRPGIPMVARGAT
jgi:hypothetical protein